MAEWNGNRKYIYIRWALLRLGLIAYDIFAVNFAYVLALLVRFYVNYEFNVWALKYIPAFLDFAPFYTVSCLIVFAAFGMYTNLWKYAGLNDMNRIVISGLITCIVQVAGTLLFVMRMPISYYVLGAAFQLVMITISRFSYRVLLIERDKLNKSKRRDAINVLVVGTAEASRTVIKHLERDAGSLAHPVCVVDFLDDAVSGTMAGIPVLQGIREIPNAVRKYEIDRVVLADSVMPAKIRKEVHELCAETGVGVQSFSEYFQCVSLKIPAWVFLEYVSGPVAIVTGEERKEFETAAQAARSLTEKYIVDSVWVEDGVLQVSLMRDVLLPNDTQAEWARDYKKETGEDISFF